MTHECLMMLQYRISMQPSRYLLKVEEIVTDVDDDEDTIDTSNYLIKKNSKRFVGVDMGDRF